MPHSLRGPFSRTSPTRPPILHGRGIISCPEDPPTSTLLGRRSTGWDPHEAARDGHHRHRRWRLVPRRLTAPLQFDGFARLARPRRALTLRGNQVGAAWFAAWVATKADRATHGGKHQCAHISAAHGETTTYARNRRFQAHVRPRHRASVSGWWRMQR
jgi:hypothetical protein